MWFVSDSRCMGLLMPAGRMTSKITAGSPAVRAILHWQYLSLCLAFHNETYLIRWPPFHTCSLQKKSYNLCCKDPEDTVLPTFMRNSWIPQSTFWWTCSYPQILLFHLYPWTDLTQSMLQWTCGTLRNSRTQLVYVKLMDSALQLSSGLFCWRVLIRQSKLSLAMSDWTSLPSASHNLLLFWM